MPTRITKDGRLTYEAKAARKTPASIKKDKAPVRKELTGQELIDIWRILIPAPDGGNPVNIQIHPNTVVPRKPKAPRKTRKKKGVVPVEPEEPTDRVIDLS